MSDGHLELTMSLWRRLVLISDYFSIVFSVFMKNGNYIFQCFRSRNLGVIINSFFLNLTFNSIANLGFPPKLFREWLFLIGFPVTTLFYITISGDLLVFQCHGLLFVFFYFSSIGPIVYLFIEVRSILLKHNKIMAVLLWKLSNVPFFHSEN